MPEQEESTKPFEVGSNLFASDISLILFCLCLAFNEHLCDFLEPKHNQVESFQSTVQHAVHIWIKRLTLSSQLHDLLVYVYKIETSNMPCCFLASSLGI